jgi:long-chain fatty acid transport protein
MKGTLIGAVLPVPFGGVLQQRVALGFGFFTPTDVVVRGRVLYPEVPQFALLADRMQTVGIMAGFGLDLGKGIRVGAGFSVLAAIAGTVVVGIDNSGAVGTKVDDQLVSSFAKTFGASYDIGKNYRVGLTYRSKLEARFAVRIEVNDLGQLTVPPLNIAGIAQYDPWNLQAEVARVVGRVKVNVGVTYKHWSSYPGAPEPTVICPAGTPDCQALVPDPPRFHSTFTPRLGVEVELASGQGWVTRLRGGYFFEPTPTPTQTTKANGFDNDRHVITVGYGLDLSKPLPPIRLDMFSQLHVLAPRTHVKDATVPTDWAGAPEAKTGGTVFAAGLVGTVRF